VVATLYEGCSDFAIKEDPAAERLRQYIQIFLGRQNHITTIVDSSDIKARGNPTETQCPGQGTQEMGKPDLPGVRRLKPEFVAVSLAHSPS
jgi:hypothetical protein